MPDNDFPIMPVLSGGPTAPLETPTTAGGPRPQSEGGFGSSFTESYQNLWDVTGLRRQIGDWKYGNQNVPQDRAVAIVKAQGLDPAFVPKTGIGYGALQEEIGRQADIRMSQIRLQRSGTGTSWGATFGGLAAGAADPANLALGPAGAEVAGLARGGLAVRAAVGAGLGAVYSGGSEAAQLHLTGHDADINSWQFLHDTAWGAALGGLGNAAFGPRTAGERNLAANNPGNLKRPGSEAFQSFGSMQEGIAAVGKQIQLYRERGIDTIEKIVGTYAPAKDHNDVAAYVADVAKRTGIDPKAKITDEQVSAVRDAMIIHEQGPGWQAKAAQFGRSHEAAARAGFENEPIVGSPIPRSLEEAESSARPQTDAEAEQMRLDTQWGNLTSAMRAADRWQDEWRQQVTDGQTIGGWQDDPIVPATDRDRAALAQTALARFATDEPHPLRTPSDTPPPGAPTPQTGTGLVPSLQAARDMLPPEYHEAFDTAMKEALANEPDMKLAPQQYENAVKAALQCALGRGVDIAGGLTNG